MSRNEPLNRKPPKAARETKGMAARLLVFGLVLLVVLGTFLHYVFPPELPDSAVIQLHGGDRVTLPAADARKLFRNMRLLSQDNSPDTLHMADTFWVTFYQGSKEVGELAVSSDNMVMHVDIGGYSHMKKAGKGINYTAMSALYTSYGGK